MTTGKTLTQHASRRILKETERTRHTECDIEITMVDGFEFNSKLPSVNAYRGTAKAGHAVCQADYLQPNMSGSIPNGVLSAWDISYNYSTIRRRMKE